jgi:hypothetical protein
LFRRWRAVCGLSFPRWSNTGRNLELRYWEFQPARPRAAVLGRKHVSQAGREEICNRAIQNFFGQGRFRPKCRVHIVAMRSDHFGNLHEVQSSKRGGKMKTEDSDHRSEEKKITNERGRVKRGAEWS